MMSPQEYNNKITALGLDNWKLKISSIPEAERVLDQIRGFQNHLWELKRGIKVDISVVWDNYRDQSKDTIGDSIAAAFLGKRTAYRIRKRTREQLVNNRDQLLSDYREVESRIDDFVNQLDDAKSQIHKFINQLRVEEQVKLAKQAPHHSHQTNTTIIYEEYIKSQKWREKAEEAKARAGNRCQVCNRSRAEVQLEAHHRTYDRLGQEFPEDITVLCRECHQLYENARKASDSSTKPLSEDGFCIRCKQAIRLNPQAPYCYTCFKIWKRFENKDYQEKYCHICGKENQSTILKPACYDCYRKNRDKLQFVKT